MAASGKPTFDYSLVKAENRAKADFGLKHYDCSFPTLIAHLIRKHSNYEKDWLTHSTSA